jgi:hypothetical protein
MSTTGSVTVPQGGALCLQITLAHSTGGKPSMLYDGTSAVGATNLVVPSLTVPESLLGFLGLAALIPLITSRRRIVAVVRRRS